MSEDILRGIAGQLNNAPASAGRVASVVTLVTANNDRIAAAALETLPFDSSPYAFQAWLAAMDHR